MFSIRIVCACVRVCKQQRPGSLDADAHAGPGHCISHVALSAFSCVIATFDIFPYLF